MSVNPKFVRRIGPHQVLISRHAAERIQDMLLDPQEVQGALLTPEAVYASPTYAGVSNRRFGRITLSTKMDEGVMVVVTAVWSSDADWQKDFDSAPYEDRARRSSEKFGLANVGASARP